MTSSIDLPPFRGSIVPRFLKSLWSRPPPPPQSFNLAGQTAIITGGNGGLALECAKTLLANGLSRLIITVRDTTKGVETVVRLRQLNPEAQVEAWPLELLSYDSILEFIQRCTTLERLDFVILNAGYTQPDFKICPATKHEEVFQINYLSTVLLALLLLPILKERHPKGKPGRITMVGSTLAFLASFPEQRAPAVIQGLDDPAQWNSQRYNTTKLMLSMFVAKVKGCISQDDVVVNVADPGFTSNGGLDRNTPAPLRSTIAVLRKLFGRSTKAGAWTYIDAAVVKPEGCHGSLLCDWTVIPFPNMMYTPEGKELTDRVWRETLDALEFAKVKDILASVGEDAHHGKETS
ncbi:hypothetical protein BX600DRAFT_488833 [Xylariales sp. PMI_506]|nr:hypothetical protein BX600DRAFT_488833 [Xylariales sp. PMI_506]